MNIPERDRERLRKLHAMLGSNSPGEAENARKMIMDLLERHKATWPDLTMLLQEDEQQQQADNSSEKTVFEFNPLDLIHHMLAEYISLTAHQLIAVTLWIAHTYVYKSFIQTPRLFLTSPVRGCGKTTLLSLIEKLTLNARKIDGISDAGLFRLLDGEPTLLLDEVDNADLPNSPVKRRVLNAGHRKGTVEVRVMNNEMVHYSLYAPVALAAIKRLHRPLMDRSIVIAMRRSRNRLPDFDGGDAALIYIEEGLRAFFRANGALLNTKPELPFKNRFADNWRPLISVADLCGLSEVRDWPALAREAALEFNKSVRDEDPEITLIEHCIGAFKSENVDRLRTDDLLAFLHSESMWSEWEGLKGNAASHQLTVHELATMLRDFDIKPRPFYPLHRKPGDKTARGYMLAPFEAAWQSYGGRDPAEWEKPAAPATVPRKIGSKRKTTKARPKRRNRKKP
jgi:acyl-CoA-binding protein